MPPGRAAPFAYNPHVVQVSTERSSMNVRNAFAAVVLAAAAAMTGYWSRQPSPASVLRAGDDSAPLGYWLRGARLSGAGDDGRIAYTITAEHAAELPGENKLELTEVTIEYRPENDVSWSVTAAHATAPKSGSPLELTGGVELTSDPADGSPPTVIKAQAMRLSAEEYTAESSGPIELRIGDDVLRAVGLRADLKADDLRLESNGHGRFTP